MSNEASIIIRDENVRKLLKRFAEKVKKPDKALAEIGEAGLSAIYDIFDAEKTSAGQWPALAESTKKQRKRAGKWPGKMLQRSGELLRSVNYRKITESGNPQVRWGTNKKYARVHQYGYKKIPKRPYLVIEGQTIQKIKGILMRYLTNA